MNDWFTWNGVDCRAYDLRVTSQPDITRPKERLSTATVPGRAGSLTLREGAHVYDSMTLTCQCLVQNPARISEISAWLTGYGRAVFAGRPDGFYLANVTNQMSYSSVVRGSPCLKLSIQFTCQPFLYLTSGQTAVTYTNTGSGILLNNLGSVPSAPLIKVYGSGDATILCGGQATYLNGLDGSLFIDSDDKIVYTESDSDFLLCGYKASGAWPSIPAGQSYLYLSEGITSVELTPRWRVL